MSSIQGVLYLRNEKEDLRWFEDVDPKTEDGKYVGQIKNGRALWSWNIHLSKWRKICR